MSGSRRSSDRQEQTFVRRSQEGKIPNGPFRGAKALLAWPMDVPRGHRTCIFGLRRQCLRQPDAPVGCGSIAAPLF